MQKEPINYVDAMIAAARRLAADLANARVWLGHADVTTHQPWRLAFLTEARRSRDRAAEELAALHERLAECGRRPPPPLDRIADKSVAMADELGSLSELLAKLERETQVIARA